MAVENAKGVLLAHMLAFARLYPWLTALSVGAMLVIPVQEILVPQLTGRIVDSLRQSTKSRNKSSGALMKTLGLVIAVMTIVQAVNMMDDAVDARIQPRLQNHFSREMLLAAMRGGDNDIGAVRGTGDLMAQFVKMPVSLGDFFETARVTFPLALSYVLAIAYFAAIDWALGVGMAVLVLVTFGTMYATADSCAGVSQRRDAAQNETQEQIDEVVRNLPAVYSSRTEASEVERLDDAQATYALVFGRSARCAMKLKFIMIPVTLAALVAAMVRCDWLVHRGSMSAGTFTSVFLVVVYLQDTLIRMIRAHRYLLFHWGVMQSSVSILGEPSAAAEPMLRAEAQAVALHVESGPKPVGPIVSMRDVRVRSLRLPDFSLRDGERVAVVGPIGSGKSTLLNLMLRFTLPTQGEMTLLGRPYASYSTPQIRAVFGYVPQAATLFNRSILENITYGSAATEDDVWACAESLGLEGALRDMHGGRLSSNVAKGGAALSGGQRQVVFLLRVALRRPRVLLLDEPTSALDDATAELVTRAVRRFPCVVAVTHDERLVRGAATRVLDLGA